LINDRNQDFSDHEINLTPLIDVSLVLVVMLLLASPLAFESSIDVRKTAATAQAAAVDDKDERIEIVVLPNDRVRVNRAEMGFDELDAALPQLIEKSVRRGVMISCESGVTHGAFVTVMDQAKMSGAVDIAVFERKAR